VSAALLAPSDAYRFVITLAVLLFIIAIFPEERS